MANILVVDDEPSARHTLALLLRKRGHRVREADGLTAALSGLAHEVFDLVLTDLRMPDGDGLDVLRAVRARRQDTPVVLVTAYAGWESAMEAIRLGALEHCEKGDSPDDLLQQVEAAVALRGRRTVLTVLFADLRSSLELLTGQELESARAVLDDVLERLMEAVHRHGGTVNQVMGDGIMALFGAPMPLPDHAARACAAAVAMQEGIVRYGRALRRGRGLDVQIRVGLASGEVIVRSVGSDFRRDYSAVGLATHLAARLEQAACPGSILMTADTRRLAGPGVLARPQGRIAVKGLLEGVDAYALLGLTTDTAGPPGGLP